MTAANTSCELENSGPGALVVKVGTTIVITASVVTVASAAPVPSALNEMRRYFTAPTNNDNPTMPLQVIITAANTVSRASDAVSLPPLIIRVTMSATSMIVTATASTNEPNGSPTRCATTSAWCTAASTAAASAAATMITGMVPRCRPQVSTGATMAIRGARVVQARSVVLR